MDEDVKENRKTSGSKSLRKLNTEGITCCPEHEKMKNMSFLDFNEFGRTFGAVSENTSKFVLKE